MTTDSGSSRQPTGNSPEANHELETFDAYPSSYVSGIFQSALEELSMGDRAREPRSIEVARLLGVELLLSKDPSKLSGGQSAAIVISSLIAHASADVLVDGLVDSLDERSRKLLTSIVTSGAAPHLKVTRHAGVNDAGLSSESCDWLELARRANPGEAVVVAPVALHGQREVLIRGLKTTRGDLHFGPINAALPKGSVSFALGPNGSGKSTLLRALAAIQPAQGEVLLCNGGRPQCHLSPQDALLDVSAPTIGEALRRSGDRSRTDMVIELLRRIGVPDDFERRRTAESVFNARCAGLIVACTSKADLILLDEPTAGLENVDVAACAISFAAENGKAVLVATHDSRLLSRFELPQPHSTYAWHAI